MAVKNLSSDIDDLDLDFDPVAAARKLPVDIRDGKVPLSDFMNIPCSKIHEFRQKKGADFNPWPSERFETLVESIRKNGVIEPVTVRPSPDGNDMYEMLAGEHRWKASIAAGLTTVPAHVMRHCSDADAESVFSITNVLHRENSMRDKINGWWHYLNAIQNQDLNMDRLISEGVISSDVQEEAEKGIRQIYRYAKMHDLIDEFIDMADRKSLSIKAGEQLAYISQECQTQLLPYGTAVNDPDKARRLHLLYKGKIEGKVWGKDTIEEILFPQSIKTETSYKVVTKSVNKMIKERVVVDAYDDIIEVMSNALDAYLEKHPEKALKKPKRK